MSKDTKKAICLVGVSVLCGVAWSIHDQAKWDRPWDAGRNPIAIETGPWQSLERCRSAPQTTTASSLLPSFH